MSAPGQFVAQLPHLTGLVERFRARAELLVTKTYSSARASWERIVTGRDGAVGGTIGG